jgi:ferric iron reductase protein FhuF
LPTIYAYPAFTEYHGINITPISFLIIDLDLKDFGVDQEDSEKKEKTSSLLEKALNKTLEKIKDAIGGNASVLWTGNGYHVYQLSADLF